MTPPMACAAQRRQGARAQREISAPSAGIPNYGGGMETDYAVPRDDLRILVETASEYEGIRAARAYSPEGRDQFDPGHRWGRILAYTWRIDPDLTLFSGVSYMAGLQSECLYLERPCPTWSTVVDHLSTAIDVKRYPDLPLDKVDRFIRGQVPHLFGGGI